MSTSSTRFFAHTSCAWAASCSIIRRCALFSRTVEVSIGLGVYVATLGTPAGCVRLCCLAGEWTQSNLWVNGGIQSSAPPVTGDVDLDGHAPNGGSIEALNGGFGFRLGWHLHKTEPPRLTSCPVGDKIDSGDLAETDKQVPEFVLGDCERQIAYIDVHDILVCVLDRAQTGRAEVHKLPYSRRHRRFHAVAHHEAADPQALPSNRM